MAGGSDQRYSTPDFAQSRDHGPCIPGKPDVVGDDTLAIYIIVHNIIIVY